jgi:hypothetical protein
MTDPAAPRHIRLWREGRLALELLGRPGPLVSTSAPPPLPGQAPPPHPFATATAFVAEWEGELGTLLRGSPDLDAFLAAVGPLGYTVEEVADPDA